LLFAKRWLRVEKRLGGCGKISIPAALKGRDFQSRRNTPLDVDFASDFDFARVGRTLLPDAFDVDFDSDVDLTLTGKGTTSVVPLSR